MMRSLHNGALEMGPLHNGALEMGPLHNGALEMRPLHNGALKMRPLHNGALKMRLALSDLVHLLSLGAYRYVAMATCHKPYTFNRCSACEG